MSLMRENQIKIQMICFCLLKSKNSKYSALAFVCVITYGDMHNFLFFLILSVKRF